MISLGFTHCCRLKVMAILQSRLMGKNMGKFMVKRIKVFKGKEMRVAQLGGS